MGKKIQKKQQPNKDSAVKKLSPLKKNELNQLIDRLFQLGFNPTTSPSEQWNQYVQMQSLLNRVKDIESELRIKTSGGKNRMAAVEAFTKWAQENGASFDSIRIAEFPGVELGLEATRDIGQNEIFATVPKKMILSLDNVSKSVAPMMSQLPMIESMQNVKLAFSLLVERLNAQSFWKPYIDVLPEKYSTVMNFTVVEMQELKGSSALPSALNQCKNIARQYAFINKFIQNVKEDQSDPLLEMLRDKFTYELYCWAISTVMTRQNSIPKSETNGTNENDENQEAQPMPALIPLWDLANHTDGIVTSNYNVEKDHIEGAALYDYKKGDQVLIYYGVRNNTNFLVHNGFVYPNNSTDSVCIRLGLSTADPLFKLRSKLLDSLGMPSTCELEVLPLPKYISTKLLGFARVFNMNEDQLNHWLASERGTDLFHLDCALETALETKTWQFLKMRLTILLKAFPTTIQEDQAILDAHKKGQNKLSHVKAMIVQFRITEKKILIDALEYVDERTKA